MSGDLIHCLQRHWVLRCSAVAVNLAAEQYDPNDGLGRESPPLIAAKVNLALTPSPDSSSDSSKSTQRRRKPQPYEGDFVLINYLGDQNHPDTATRAGREALPASDDSDQGIQMASPSAQSQIRDRSESDSPRNRKSPSAGRFDPQETARVNSPPVRDGRPPRPTIFIQPSGPSTYQNPLRHPSPPRPHVPSFSISPQSPDRRPPLAVTDNHTALRRTGYDRQYERSRSRSPDRSSRNEWTKPMSRSNTVPISTHTTLPPMQPQLLATAAARSPARTESIPSIAQSNLKELLNKPPPSRPMNETFPSPPNFLKPPQPITHAHGQLSPVGSDASPGSALSAPEGSGSSLLPQGNFGQSRQNELLTPQSANSYLGSQTFSTTGSPLRLEPPGPDQRGRELPLPVPNSGTSLLTGSFKCDYEGCTAPPFQTQYLLKYENFLVFMLITEANNDSVPMRMYTLRRDLTIVRYPAATEAKVAKVSRGKMR